MYSKSKMKAPVAKSVGGKGMKKMKASGGKVAGVRATPQKRGNPAVKSAEKKSNKLSKAQYDAALSKVKF